MSWLFLMFTIRDTHGTSTLLASWFVCFHLNSENTLTRFFSPADPLRQRPSRLGRQRHPVVATFLYASVKGFYRFMGCRDLSYSCRAKRFVRGHRTFLFLQQVFFGWKTKQQHVEIDLYNSFVKTNKCTCKTQYAVTLQAGPVQLSPERT